MSAAHLAAALNRGPRKHLKPRCQAFTKAGTRCTNSGTPFCYHHDHSGRPVSVRLEDQPGPSHLNVAKALKAQGCEIIACAAGWPDLLVKRNGQLAAIEVKKDDTLSDAQRRVISELVHIMPAHVVRLRGFKQEGECSFDELLEHLEIETAQREYYGA